MAGKSSTATIPKETVKTLAKAIGLRPAARQLGLNENLVLQWSNRDPEGPWSVAKAERNQNVITPSDAIGDSLSSYSKRSKHALAKAGTKAAEHLASDKVSATQVLKSARQMKDVAGTLQTVLGWNESKQGSGTLNLNVLGGQTAIQVVNGPSRAEDGV